MGLFNRRNEGPAARQPAAGAQQSAPAPAVGSSSWARQVLAVLAPPQPGYMKRCSCVVCGAPKKLPSVAAYVYCDYCASLIDFDLRLASESDTQPDPAYAATVNSAYPASQAAAAAGDRGAYRELQKTVYEAYVTHVPAAVSHRARNDADYRRRYVGYMAEAAVARAFDPGARALEAEMQQRVVGLRYAGNMMAPAMEPGSFGCGRTIDLGAAEVACATCGGSITMPAGVERVSCRYCRAEIRKAGIR
jgi:DNA-directed RNA polymerase subunit RPC12/RpoP